VGRKKTKNSAAEIEWVAPDTSPAQEREVFKSATSPPRMGSRSFFQKSAVKNLHEEEEHAQKLVSTFEEVGRLRLARLTPPLNAEDGWILGTSLADLRRQFDALAATIDPALSGEGHKALHILMDHCFNIGAIGTFSRKERARLRGSAIGHAASLRKRQENAKTGWKREATIIINELSKNPRLSGEAIAQRTKTGLSEKNLREEGSIKKLIREIIPRGSRKRI